MFPGVPRFPQGRPQVIIRRRAGMVPSPVRFLPSQPARSLAPSRSTRQPPQRTAFQDAHLVERGRETNSSSPYPTRGGFGGMFLLARWKGPFGSGIDWKGRRLHIALPELSSACAPHGEQLRPAINNPITDTGRYKALSRGRMLPQRRPYLIADSQGAKDRSRISTS
jgi:hypothetical protein